MVEKSQTTPPMPTWHRSFSNHALVTVRLEGEYDPIGQKVPRGALFRLAPGLADYLDDPFGDTIILPANSVNENAAEAVINGIASATEFGSKLAVWYVYSPIASIEMHRVFTVFGMKEQEQEAHARL
jgi:hypothetical protein